MVDRSIQFEQGHTQQNDLLAKIVVYPEICLASFMSDMKNIVFLSTSSPNQPHFNI